MTRRRWETSEGREELGVRRRWFLKYKRTIRKSSLAKAWATAGGGEDRRGGREKGKVELTKGRKSSLLSLFSFQRV